MCDHRGRVIGVLQFINRRSRTVAGIEFVPFDEEVTDLHRARLLLVDATRVVLANGLALLGVSAPERM